jgi:hypothetical protein
MSHEPKLADTQRWFSGLVMRPLNADNHMRIPGEDGRALAEIDSIIAPNEKLSAFERLEVYNRQYWFRLFEALDADFPALIKLIGDGHFRQLAEAYLTDCPSISYTLRDLGSRLPQWLVANPQHVRDFPQAAVDIARLEWAYVEAFDAAELPPATPEQLQQAGEEGNIRLQPHIRFVELHTAIDEFTAKAHDYQFGRRDKQHRRFKRDRFKLLPETFTVAVYRMHDQVAQLPLDPEAVTLLKSLAEGKSLGDALEATFLNSPLSDEQNAARIQQWFATWSGLQWFCV